MRLVVREGLWRRTPELSPRYDGAKGGCPTMCRIQAEPGWLVVLASFPTGPGALEMGPRLCLWLLHHLLRVGGGGGRVSGTPLGGGICQEKEEPLHPSHELSKGAAQVWGGREHKGLTSVHRCHRPTSYRGPLPGPLPGDCCPGLIFLPHDPVTSWPLWPSPNSRAWGPPTFPWDPQTSLTCVPTMHWASKAKARGSLLEQSKGASSLPCVSCGRGCSPLLLPFRAMPRRFLGALCFSGWGGERTGIATEK